MKPYKILYGIVFCSVVCFGQKNFEKKALNDVFTDLADKPITFEKILKKYKGKKIFIDVWASWCPDCIRGLPKVKALQKKYDDVVWLFLSLDRSTPKWKKGIEKYALKGEHYFVNNAWKSDFAKAIKLDWIPRYMIVNKQGNILLFKAIKANDKRITQHLN